MINLLTPVLLNEARTLARQTDRAMIEVLEEKSELAPEAFVAMLARIWHYPALSMVELHAWMADFGVITYADAVKHGCVALRAVDGSLHLVIADPFNADLPEWAAAKVGVPFVWALAHHKDIAAYLSMHEDGMRAMDGLLPEGGSDIALESGLGDLSLLTISEDTSPVIRLVHSTLYDALKSGVSDIHLETDVDRLVIKYRQDGVLSAVGNVNGLSLAEQVVSRIKVMAELDIAERRVPQDGRFKVSMRGREVDFRVSVMPSIFGEDVVMRILDRSTISDHVNGMRLDDLGFDEDTMTRFRRMALEPYGMVLVTGPTGSGKTTSLYAAISEVNDGHDKIITIEDPVEYRLPGVLQIPVNEKKGLTFARGLRSILRHDPDKIMVGEIRDPETAQIAVQSALTGHLVFTTVHANSVFDVISRFIHMGVDPFSFASAMNGVVSQRLLRMICPHCIADDVPTAQMLQISGLTQKDLSGFKFRIGRGCGQCRSTGYKGRRAIAEILILDDHLREMIVAREPIRKVKEAARENGTRFLRDVALELVRTGETTLQEINRVTFVS